MEKRSPSPPPQKKEDEGQRVRRGKEVERKSGGEGVREGKGGGRRDDQLQPACAAAGWKWGATVTQAITHTSVTFFSATEMFVLYIKYRVAIKLDPIHVTETF